MQKKYYLYWIHRKCHTDITTEGYLGITNNFRKRMDKHRSLTKQNYQSHLCRALRKYTDIVMEYICVGDIDYIMDLEFRLRPTQNIGWNMVAGGDSPSSYPPSYEQLLERSKTQTKIKRSDCLKILYQYFKLGMTRKELSNKYGVSNGPIDTIIDGNRGMHCDLIIQVRKIFKETQSYNSCRSGTLTEDLYNIILTRKEAGETAQEIADDLGLKTSMIIRYCLGKPKFLKKFSCYRIVSSDEPKKYLFDNKYLTIKEWSLILKLTESTLNRRLREGWPIEDVFNKEKKLGRNQYASKEV